MSKIKKAILFCSLVFVTLAGCHKAEKFTTKKWLNGDGVQFPLRDDVLDDLVQHNKLKGMTYKQMQHLLGYPDGRDSVSFYYQVINTYNNMFKHTRVKNLVFYMGKDSVISKYEVYDKKYKN